MQKTVIAKCVRMFLFAVTVCVFGYMVVQGNAQGGELNGILTREGMSSEISGDVYKNSAKIALVEEKVDNLKDVKRDLEEIRLKLKANTKETTTLRELVVESNKKAADDVIF